MDALAGFLRATGWSCIYGINLGGAATGATTPALAAAEVAYVAAQLGTALLGVELGNECETYGDRGSFFAGNWSVEAFEALWQQFRSAIVAATPGVPFAGPAAASDVYSWSLPFGEYVTADQLSLLTQHYTHGTASERNRRRPDRARHRTHHRAARAALRRAVHRRALPPRCLRGLRQGGAPGVSNAYASSLWAIDTVFQTALGGGSGINFQAGGQQPSTPIIDNNGSILGPQRRSSTVFCWPRMAGAGTLLSTQLSAASLNVTRLRRAGCKRRR